MAVVWRKRKNLAQNVCQPAKCYYKSGLGTVNYAILHGNLFVIHSMLDVAPWRFTTLKFVGLLLARESCRERSNACSRDMMNCAALCHFLLSWIRYVNNWGYCGTVCWTWWFFLLYEQYCIILPEWQVGFL